jgi:hypothetical protein
MYLSNRSCRIIRNDNTNSIRSGNSNNTSSINTNMSGNTNLSRISDISISCFRNIKYDTKVIKNRSYTSISEIIKTIDSIINGVKPDYIAQYLLSNSYVHTFFFYKIDEELIIKSHAKFIHENFLVNYIHSMVNKRIYNSFIFKNGISSNFGITNCLKGYYTNINDFYEYINKEIEGKIEKCLLYPENLKKFNNKINTHNQILRIFEPFITINFRYIPKYTVRYFIDIEKAQILYIFSLCEIEKYIIIELIMRTFLKTNHGYNNNNNRNPQLFISGKRDYYCEGSNPYYIIFKDTKLIIPYFRNRFKGIEDSIVGCSIIHNSKGIVDKLNSKEHNENNNNSNIIQNNITVNIDPIKSHTKILEKLRNYMDLIKDPLY